MPGESLYPAYSYISLFVYKFYMRIFCPRFFVKFMKRILEGILGKFFIKKYMIVRCVNIHCTKALGYLRIKYCHIIWVKGYIGKFQLKSLSYRIIKLLVKKI